MGAKLKPNYKRNKYIYTRSKKYFKQLWEKNKNKLEN